MWRLLFFILATTAEDISDKDGENSRKILGSSVVTSVSVIMDAGNGSKIYADAVGKPVSKPHLPTEVASPIELLNPDRYEFYTFDDTGDLVKRLMTLEEIHDIIATGDDDGFTLDSFASNGFVPEKRVNDVVNNVQNVLKEEIKMHKNPGKPHFDTPDVSDSWSMILPAVFGNSGDDIVPERPVSYITPDTIMVEPTIKVVATTEQISTTEKVMTLQTKKTTPKTSIATTTEKRPMINVEVITNSNSTSERTVDINSANLPVVEIKPFNDLEQTKEYTKPHYHVSKSTKRPFLPKITTFRPSKKPSKFTTTLTTSTSSQQPSTTSPTTSTTSNNDLLTQASTVVFKKIIPLTSSTTTVNTITTVRPKITSIPPTERFTSSQTELSVTSSTESTTTTEEITTSTDKETSTVTEATSTFSTFLTAEDDKSTTENNNSKEDFDALSTDSITVKTLLEKTDSTTEPQFTDKTTSVAFDQLLLSVTNIYEINSELSDIKQIADSFESTTSSEEKNTEKYYIKLTNPTEIPTPTTTTDQSLISAIEQLISQAVGTAAPPVESEKEVTAIQEIMLKSSNKTMPEVIAETATLASNLISSRESTTIPSTTPDNMQILSESVESLLSQVYGQVSTVLEYETPTTEMSSTILPSTTSTEIGTTEAPTTVTAEEISTSSYKPHIINITIIRNKNQNQTKPAKSDLTLEKDFQSIIEEIKMNSTFIPLVADELLKTEASSFIKEQTTATTITATTTTTTATTTTTTEAVTAPSTTEEDISSNKFTTNISTDVPSITNTSESKPSVEMTINEIKKNDSDSTNWTLVSTVAPHSDVKMSEPVTKESLTYKLGNIVDLPVPVDLVPKPLQGFGLEDSTAKLDTDIYQFVQLCNELAFGFWKSVTSSISSARSVIISPFAATSLLAMVFLGARGATSGEMNEILKLDDMVTFNPHLIFKNVSESIEVNLDSGVAISAIIRELYSDRMKGKLLGFYKERVRQFYDGHVEEVGFREIGDIIRRRTNLLVKKNTNGEISEFLKDGNIIPKPPLAGISISIFQTDCSQGMTGGRDGELHFIVLPSLRQRRLIPIPAITFRHGFLAGYEPSLDATAAALGSKDQTISTIFIMPGQQGMTAPGDGLARLEKRLGESSFKKGAWSRLLRALIPRPGLELQIPRFQHRSVINATESLKKMGLHELFDAHKADLKGLNGAAHELHLSDVVQINEFATCGERKIGDTHHKEMYPATAQRRTWRLLEVESEWEEPRDYQRAFHDPLHDPSFFNLPLSLRPRQARLPETPRLRFDRPFLYFVRHNPSGLILHMGRFHPRLMP